MSNTFGEILRLTTAGESHGAGYVGILDGMPAGLRIDFDAIRLEMSHRRPGQSNSTARNEADEVKFLSGVLDGVTLGTPVAFMIQNTDAHSADYDQLRKTFRPSHADYTYQAKYGIRAVAGGGRASARETALRVVAGALAMQVLSRHGIKIEAYTSQIGDVKLASGFDNLDTSRIWSSPVRCPDVSVSERMEAKLAEMRKTGNTVGCVVSGIIDGLPAGVGEPMYDKLQARLAYAMMSINAAHGFDYGGGFAMSEGYGSELYDRFVTDSCGRVATATNNSGGIQGGISNGMPVTFRVGFKPLPTMMQPVESIDMEGNTIIIEPRGRHDVCAVPRAVPVVRAMAAMTVLDQLLQFEAYRNL